MRASSRHRMAFHDPEGVRHQGTPSGAPAGAKPTRAASPAQLVALGAAMPARRTCSSCGQVRPYCIPRSLGECGPCAAAAGQVAAA